MKVFKEENVRRKWEHVDGGEANLKADEVIGTTTRWRDMLIDVVVCRRWCFGVEVDNDDIVMVAVKLIYCGIHRMISHPVVTF